jgi:hypothetical protein
MTAADFGFWVATAAAVIGTGYTALTYHRPPAKPSPRGTARGVAMDDRKVSRRALIARWIPTGVALCALEFDYYDRNFLRRPIGASTNSFEREIVYLRDIVEGGARLLSQKTFYKCQIIGPPRCGIPRI